MPLSFTIIINYTTTIFDKYEQVCTWYLTIHITHFKSCSSSDTVFPLRKIQLSHRQIAIEALPHYDIATLDRP